MNLDSVAQRLFEGVMAPMVLGGAVRPGRAIGARTALALGDRRPADATLASRVDAARVRIARRLTPVDSVPAAQSADWALAAAFHDLLQSVHPTLAAPFRRRAAARILETARATLEHIASPTTTGEALSRHTWLARLLDVRRTDTSVSWWSGSQRFLGTDPPARVRAWPRLRRVTLATEQHAWLDLEPMGVDRTELGACVALLLSQTPLTDLSTCIRKDPVFAWTPPTLHLVARDAGRSLSLRALSRLDPELADTALGASFRALLTNGTPAAVSAVMDLLADRAVSALEADERAPLALPAAAPSADAVLARGVGAFAARRQILSSDSMWSRSQRDPLLAALDGAIARTPKIDRFVGRTGQ